MNPNTMQKKKDDEEQRKGNNNNQGWVWGLGIGLAVIFVVLLVFLVIASTGAHHGSYYGPSTDSSILHDSGLSWCDFDYDTNLDSLTHMPTGITIIAHNS